MSKKPIVYFKVIRKESRTSALITTKGVKVYYPVNEWVKPEIEGSRLMVFKWYKDADRWMNAFDGSVKSTKLMVVKCYIKHPLKNDLVKYVTIKGSRLLSNFKKFWKNFSSYRKLEFREKRKVDNISDRIPDGTIFAAEVKCLE